MAEEEQLLNPTETYLKSGIHIGTKFKTKFMKQFIYKSRLDGLSVLNLKKIDERLKIVGDFISNYAPEDIVVACRRENGWKAAKKFGELTGARVFTGRYPPGILTNVNLKNFIETKLIILVDPWPDRNILQDALISGIPVVALCDTNNHVNGVDLVLPVNNKGKKSLGLIFWTLTSLYLKNRGLLDKNIVLDTPVEEFAED